jgi:hypothetical protein
MMRRLGLIAAGLALALGVGGPAFAKPPIWFVRSHGATVVLFGSIHLLPAGLDWRPPALDDALAHADALWFELPITVDSDNEAQAESARRGELAPGASLLALLAPAQADKFKRVADELHLSIDDLDQMQPWKAELSISVADDAASGADAFNGVEDQIQAIAPIAISRGAFETPDEQVQFLAGAPMADQIASLNWTLSEVEDDPGTYNRVVDEWMAADLLGLQRDAVDPLRRIAPMLYERLIAVRNHHWADTVRQVLLKRRGETTVVVVGVGHLVGPEGLPTLLRSQGLDVEGP